MSLSNGSDRERLKKEVSDARRETDNVENCLEAVREELAKAELKIQVLKEVITEIARN